MTKREGEVDPLSPEDMVDEDEMFAPREARARHRTVPVPDFVRRAIENTMGSVHNTQTASREALQYFLSTTDKTKREIVRIVASEVGQFLRQMDISSEIIKVLTGVQADVQISVRFKLTEDGSLQPEIETRRPPESEAVSSTGPGSSAPGAGHPAGHPVGGRGPRGSGPGPDGDALSGAPERAPSGAGFGRDEEP